VCRESDNIERAGLIAAVEQAADGIVITGTDGKIQYVNPAFTAMTGYTSEEAVGQYPRVLKSGRQPAAVYEDLWKTIRGGRVWRGELINRRKDGTLYDEEMRIAPVEGANGEVVNYIAIKRDVTGRRTSDEARALLAAIVDGSDDAIASCSTAGIVLSWNRAAEEIFGYSAAEIMGKHVSMLVPPDRLDSLLNLLDRIQRGQPVSQHEGVCLHKDGRRFHISVTGSPVRNAAGEMVAISAVVRDISERREGEQAQALLASVVESSDDAIVATMLDGSIVSWNRSAELLFGYSRREAIGENISLLVAPHERDEQRRYLDAIGQGCALCPFERRLLRKDGSTVEALLSISPIRNPTGDVVGAAATIRDIAERKRTDERLRESEERFRIMADGCPSPMWVTNAAGGLQFINRAYRELCGTTCEQVAGNKWQLAIHPDDVAAHTAEFYRAVRDHAPFKAEARVRRADGEWRWVVSFGAPRFSPGGEYLGHVGLSPDITERKRAEVALRESEERYRMLAHALRSTDECVNITDTENRILYVNDAFLRTYGYREDELIGQNIAMVRSARTPPGTYAEILPATLAGGWRGELWNRSQQGREFLISLATSQVCDETGRRVALVGVARDITEQKESEEALRSSEEKFRQLTENMRGVVWMMVPGSDKLLYVSPAYERVWGRTCESVYRDPASRLEAIHPDDLEHCRVSFARQMRGEHLESEFRIRTPDGREKWIGGRAFPVRGQDGKVIRVVGIAEDITQRKRYETELIQAREAADSANRAKSCFLANMSHEIRTPMNGVIGMIQLLLETDLTAEQRQYANVIQTSGGVLLNLIDDILDLSKIEARRVTLENVGVSVRQTFGEVVQLLRVQAGAKGLRMDARVSADVPAVLRGDGRRLRQVLTNLAANAVKFTPHGSIQLNASVDRVDSGTATVRFTVADTGIGIRRDQAERLFAPFVQADDSTTRKYGGTGLGLAISKQLVGMMGGTIGVDSQEGRGSTFWFTAVFGTAAETAQPPAGERPDERPAAAPATAPVARDAKILVAEDNAINRDVALAQLRKLGYQATAVVNGAEAVEAVRRGGYDLVLMDCEMPVLDGFAATRRIRESIDPGISILAVTAFAMTGDRERCLNAGMNDYLAKPMELNRLAELLTRWLPESRGADRAQTPAEPAAEPAMAAFNPEVLLRRTMGDRQLADSVVKGFLADVPSQLDTLRQRVHGADAPGAQSLAQSLTSAAATVAADSLHAIAAAMERAGAVGQLDRCGELLPRASEEFERFKGALERAGWAKIRVAQSTVRTKDHD
jgi:PAS domain S-box-containing protein